MELSSKFLKAVQDDEFTELSAHMRPTCECGHASGFQYVMTETLAPTKCPLCNTQVIVRASEEVKKRYAAAWTKYGIHNPDRPAIVRRDFDNPSLSSLGISTYLNQGRPDHPLDKLLR